MTLKSNAQTSNSLRQYRNSRCGSDRYKDIRLTEGGLGLHELETEKSAEVIVVNRMSRHRKGKVGILIALMKD